VQPEEFSVHAMVNYGSFLVNWDIIILQKGDFVVERKDGWKTEGFPIWRIETGKLLQKFDPVVIEGGIIHKSASVVSI
jgi:hypothetical protein